METCCIKQWLLNLRHKLSFGECSFLFRISDSIIFASLDILSWEVEQENSGSKLELYSYIIIQCNNIEFLKVSGNRPFKCQQAFIAKNISHTYGSHWLFVCMGNSSILLGMLIC